MARKPRQRGKGRRNLVAKYVLVGTTVQVSPGVPMHGVGRSHVRTARGPIIGIAHCPKHDAQMPKREYSPHCPVIDLGPGRQALSGALPMSYLT